MKIWLGSIPSQDPKLKSSPNTENILLKCMFETDTADNSLAEVIQHMPCHSLYDV